MTQTKRVTSDAPQMSQADILKAVIEKTKHIDRLQKQADTKGFETYGGAIALQRLRQERKVLQAQLDKPRVVSG